jgi:hypothetical protein
VIPAVLARGSKMSVDFPLRKSALTPEQLARLAEVGKAALRQRGLVA